MCQSKSYLIVSEMNETNNEGYYSEKEAACRLSYLKVGALRHCCTPEDYKVLFLTPDDFKQGVSMLGICAKVFPKVKIVTFQLMSNHLHIVVVGDEADIYAMFELFKRMLSKHLNKLGRPAGLDGFDLKIFTAESLEAARNYIAYTNRNGAKVHPDTTPFTYPWGANRFFFSPESKQRYWEQKRPLQAREKRCITMSKLFDNINGLYVVDDYVSPMSFCDIGIAESLFRDARHYCSKASRHVESYNDIAKLIGEQISYTDDELFAAIISICKKDYEDCRPTALPQQAKISLARKLHFEYNASNKQIQRMLSLSPNILNTLF